MMNGTPPGSIHVCHPSEWIQSEIFLSGFFISSNIQSRQNNPVIWVLDTDYSHTRNVEVFTLALENYVDIICLPLHNSHKMYP